VFTPCSSRLQLSVIPHGPAFIALGPAWGWIADSRWATLIMTGSVMAAIPRSLSGRPRHRPNGSTTPASHHDPPGNAILTRLPWWALLRGPSRASIRSPGSAPKPIGSASAIFGKMDRGGTHADPSSTLAILAGECRGQQRATLGQSVVISAPVIASCSSSGIQHRTHLPQRQAHQSHGLYRKHFASLRSLGRSRFASRSLASYSSWRAPSPAPALIFTGLTPLPPGHRMRTNLVTRGLPPRRAPPNAR